ncbi:MAG: hypothetical protein IAE80_14400 [Anaerolinea sp.]|nr:hypothetical protein [Anaerolinea sp.]
MLPEYTQTYQAIIAFFVIGFGITTVEYLAIAAQFAPGGIFAWRLHSLDWGMRVRGASFKRALSTVYSQQGVLLMLWLRLLALVGLVVVPVDSPITPLLLTVIVGSTLLFNARQTYGGDGADQMLSLLALTLLLCLNPFSTPLTLSAGLWFIALQACTAYCAAGVAKLISPVWRGGDAVYKVFNTGSYGIASVGQYLGKHKTMRLLLSWSVMIAETLFPLVLFLPAPFNWVFLAWGAVFHLLNALIMGLNTFFWAFLATYPAILFVSAQMQHALYGG